MTEKNLQSRVIYRAKKNGWRVAHAGRGMIGTRDDGSPIFVTPIAPGWPDLTCAKAGNRIIFIELKKELEDPKPEQIEWLQLLNVCGAVAIIVRPSDLREGRVDTIFRGGSPLWP